MILNPGARDWMRRHGVDEETVLAVIRRPKNLVLQEDGRTVCFGRGIMVVVAPDGVVLSVADSLVGAPPPQALKRGKRTKGGSVWPTSWSEMRARILAHGLHITTDTGGHDKVRHPDTGEVLGIIPRGERRSRGKYAAHTDLGQALLRHGYDLRNKRS